MQYSENYYGTLPRLDESKAYDDKVRNTSVKFGGVNYTNDESLWNYYPLFAEWEGREVNASETFIVKSGMVAEMVESFKAGEQSGAPGDPIGVDCEHRIYSENGGELIGYVVDVKDYAGEIVTYTASGVRVIRENPENTHYLMAKMAWLADGYELVKSGALPFPSIVWNENEKTGKVTMGIPTITGNPADKAVPAIVACTAKTIESEDIMNRDQLLADLMEWMQTLPDTELQALHDEKLGNAPTEEATPEPTAEASGNDEIKGMLQNILDRLNAPVAASEKPDEGVVTAKAELIKSGVLPSVASDLANNFAGIPAKESVICAKAYIDNNPIKLGSQVAGVIPVDTYETLMKKFQKEGLNTLEASKKAREALKGDN